MSIRNAEQLTGIRNVSQAVAVTLKAMCDYAKPGMNTLDLDQYGYGILRQYNAVPAPKKEYGFPGYTCISVNEEAAHGIPSRTKILKEGDLVNIDVSAELGGYYGDNGCSFILGNDINRRDPLIRASREILYGAIDRIKHGVRISTVGGFIEAEAKKRGFTTIRNIVGHGIGYKLHEWPNEIPCYKDRSNKDRFRKNTVIALETFISTGARYVHTQNDGWTLKASDGSLVAQHEHTLIVTDDYPIILTTNNGV